MQTQQLSYESERLGPLAQLVGAWEGEQGHDTWPATEQSVETSYRETISFEPVGPIRSGSKMLYGLRYSTSSWPRGQEQPFHEELGYWLWSPEDKQVIRCFSKYNGIAINACGCCDSDAHHIEMSAQVDSDVFGITSTPALNDGFKTIAYKLQVDVQNENQFSYIEEMQLRHDTKQNIIIHIDENALTRVY